MNDEKIGLKNAVCMLLSFMCTNRVTIIGPTELLKNNEHWFKLRIIFNWFFRIWSQKPLADW